MISSSTRPPVPDSQALLGAGILGGNGDETIHCLLDTMYA